MVAVSWYVYTEFTARLQNSGSLVNEHSLVVNEHFNLWWSFSSGSCTVKSMASCYFGQTGGSTSNTAQHRDIAAGRQARRISDPQFQPIQSLHNMLMCH